MILLGRTQVLKVVKQSEIGLFVSGDNVPDELNINTEVKPQANEEINMERILLPKKEAGKAKEGEFIKVFVYKDSEDRPIATTLEPKVELGKIAKLKVKDVTNIGAFLDWGLLKDLFLPFKQQTYRVKPGDDVLVSLYIDKSSRLCATMKVYPYFTELSTYKKNDKVTGTVYEIIDSFGAYVAVDDRYSALIPKHRLFKKLNPGDVVNAQVVKVQDDGRLELSIEEKSYLSLTADGENILSQLVKAGGFLPYHDKTAPALIEAKFGMSKNAFKRAIGHLKKEGKIIIEDDGISTVEE